MARTASARSVAPRPFGDITVYACSQGGEEYPIGATMPKRRDFQNRVDVAHGSKAGDALHARHRQIEQCQRDVFALGKPLDRLVE